MIYRIRQKHDRPRPSGRCRALLLAGLIVLSLTAGCRPGEQAPLREIRVEDRTSLTVFAAASLAEAFAAVAQAFEARYAGAEVVLNLAGSQQLAQQLRLGAPADVFASADRQQMRAAVEAGRVEEDAPQPFARNRLVVVLPKDNPAGLSRLQDLTRPGLRLVLAAEDVPAGRYARLFLEKASGEAAFGATYAQQVRARVASFEQSVRAVLTKVTLGEADAGIVYTSDLAGADAGVVTRLEIPEALNTLAVYPIAPVSDTAHPDLARAFVAFVRSPEGQEILIRHGFAPSPPS